MRCARRGCAGAIVDGYCDDCGLAPARPAGVPAARVEAGALAPPVVPVPVPAAAPAREPGTEVVPRADSGGRSVRSARIGGGLVEPATVMARDPATAVLLDPHVAEHRRFCSSCDERVGRGRDGEPGRTDGFCRRCGTRFSFTPALGAGDLVGGQYEVEGCLAHGGLGWIYLARDRKVADRWVVLKGLLDAGNEEAVAVAVAERRFLAEVEHPNIVQIHNFVEHDGAGYIVMEHVNGVSLRHLLDERRAANGGRSDPLPVEQAIAYCLEVLPALGHLHDLGLAYCDLKPDNVILTPSTVKLIDLGGVYRMDDRASPMYGTVGYQAPEIATTGPTIASDLYTVGRTLAALCTDFASFQSTWRHALPGPDVEPVFAEWESLHRVLARATDLDPARRFQRADEMAGQLLGVLREVVATRTGEPRPGTSTCFAAARRVRTTEPDPAGLPTPLVDPDDVNAGLVLTMAAAGPDEVAGARAHALTPSVGLDLWLVRVLLDAGRRAEAVTVLDELADSGRSDWRTTWYRAIASLGSGDLPAAAAGFGEVRRWLPGELAPTLALGVTAELAGDHAAAARCYRIVAVTDPAFTAASFGLARCCRAVGDVDGERAAYRRVPDTSIAHTDAQVAEVRLLLTGATSMADVAAAAAILERTTLADAERTRVVTTVLETALRFVGADDGRSHLFGEPATERRVRTRLEAAYRESARAAATSSQRIALVDRANRVRPRTWR